MTLPLIKLIIFDFDGTINNDKLRQYITAKRVCARFHLQRSGITPFAMTTTRGVPSNVRKGPKARQVTFQFLKYWNPQVFPLWKRAWIYLNYEWEYTRVGKNYIFLFPGVVDLMKDLHAAGYYLGIATNRGSGTIKQQLKLAGILSQFTGIYGYNNVRHGKPDPEMIFRNIQIIRKKHNVVIHTPETLVVGDNLKEDIGAGTRAGACTALVTRVQAKMLDNHPIKPNLIVTNVLALKQFLLNKEQREKVTIVRS